MVLGFTDVLGNLGSGVLENLLFELEDAAAYNLTVDLDVGAIGPDSECTRAQVVYVLTAINSEV